MEDWTRLTDPILNANLDVIERGLYEIEQIYVFGVEPEDEEFLFGFTRVKRLVPAQHVHFYMRTLI